MYQKLFQALIYSSNDPMASPAIIPISHMRQLGPRDIGESFV